MDAEVMQHFGPRERQGHVRIVYCHILITLTVLTLRLSIPFTINSCLSTLPNLNVSDI